MSVIGGLIPATVISATQPLDGLKHTENEKGHIDVASTQ